MSRQAVDFVSFKVQVEDTNADEPKNQRAFGKLNFFLVFHYVETITKLENYRMMYAIVLYTYKKFPYL